MSVRHPKITTGNKIYRGKSNPNYKNKLNYNQNVKLKNNDDKIFENSPKIKLDYNTNNYFYNNAEYYNNDLIYRNVDFLNLDDKQKYNKESSTSHMTADIEDPYFNYFSNKLNYNYNYNTNDNDNKNGFKRISSPQIYKSNLDPNYFEINTPKNFRYFDDNSEYSENNNINIYYENEVYDNGLYNFESPNVKYNLFQDNINFYLSPNNNLKQNKKNNNKCILSKSINQQLNFMNDKKNTKKQVKKNNNNFSSNSTTTNNTYNNNIYYINNPINVKNNNKIKDKNKNIVNYNHKYKKNNSKKNLIYKSADITLQKNNDKEYIKINNLDKNKKDLLINSIILIQRVFRGYLVKIKLYNNVNLYVCCKRGVFMLENLLLKLKKKELKKFIKKLKTIKIYGNIINTPLNKKSKSNSCLKNYGTKKKIGNNNSKSNNILMLKEKPKTINVFHKELRDSFNIINRNIKRENNEKKLKCKLNDVIKQNKELKNKINDNKIIEEKIKSLLDENKKNQNINAIIMKDNQQLAKKLKDYQDYRSNKLIIENQYYLNLTQIEQKEKIEQLKISNELYMNQLKKIILQKYLYNKINNNKNIIKKKMNKYRNIVHKLIDIDKEIKYKKELHLKNIITIIENHFKLILNKYFLKIYNDGIKIQKEINIKELKSNLLNDKLRKIIYNIENKKKEILYKAFFKFIINNIKYSNEKMKKEEEDKKDMLKIEMLKNIFAKYEKNVRIIYKVFLEKWNLSSKIIGMKTAARDKKKKRKQKKKNNKLLYNKNYYNNALGPKVYKNINEFSIVSNGGLIKESNTNESCGNVFILESNSTNNLYNNRIIKENKKHKSLSKINMKANSNIFKDNKENICNNNQNINIINNNIDNINNLENINNNEESEEDSGDTFGIENNSD